MNNRNSSFQGNRKPVGNFKTRSRAGFSNTNRDGATSSYARNNASSFGSDVRKSFSRNGASNRTSHSASNSSSHDSTSKYNRSGFSSSPARSSSYKSNGTSAYGRNGTSNVSSNNRTSGGSVNRTSSGSFSRTSSGGSSSRGGFGKFARTSSSGRSSSGRSFGGRSSGGRSSGGRFGKKAIDVSRFINKVTIVEEAEVFVPANKFSDFHIDEKLKQTISDRGFILPTPIQDKVIPHILQGQDVVGMANTGTGKTAAFLIPLIDKIIKDKNQKVLVIVPTRELATQINDELRAFVKGLSIFSCVCVGGANMSIQIKDLARSHNFVIGTPGRLKDLIDKRFINLKNFSNFVLDEADRMLDMGFINDIKQIVKQMPQEKHGLFFSATLSKEIELLIQNFLKEPLKISVKTQEVSKNIEQDVIKVKKEEKMEELIKLLSKEEFSKVLVFGQTKHGVEKIFQTLKDKGFKVDSIHGNKTQGHRQKTLTKFKKDEINILIATDVAARGLDINNISHVINYDTPDNHEDYVHRIGRTGRGDKKGIALTFVH
jgi:ATP-dependent RNA helicase RhlE